MSEADRLPELPERHSRLELRRARWFRAHRLSPAEIVEIPASFDPGPEFDPLPDSELATAGSPTV